MTDEKLHLMGVNLPMEQIARLRVLGRETFGHNFAMSILVREAITDLFIKYEKKAVKAASAKAKRREKLSVQSTNAV